MADLFFFFFFCKLQPQENNLSVQLNLCPCKKVSLISYSTVYPQNFIFQRVHHIWGFTVSIAGGMKPTTLSLEPSQYEEFSDLKQLLQMPVDFSSILTLFFSSNVC